MPSPALGLGDGARTLVIGAGPIGLGTALFAGLAGGEVTLMDRDADRLAFAMEAGSPQRRSRP